MKEKSDYIKKMKKLGTELKRFGYSKPALSRQVGYGTNEKRIKDLLEGKRVDAAATKILIDLRDAHINELAALTQQI